MPRSLVLGVNGQDGSYLAEILLRRGYDVVGCGRDDGSRYIEGIGFTYTKTDVRDLTALESLLRRVSPDLVFHFAAVHGAAGFEYEGAWRDMMTVNVLSLHVLLEYARLQNRSARIIYAGSSKMFPTPLTGTIDEATPARATCLYSIGKIAARDLIEQYRDRHGVTATNLVFFNHESVRRPSNYFLPTIARSIARAKADPSHRTQIKTLDFRMDWSAAEDLMDLSVDIAQRSNVGEVIMASGNTWLARAAVAHLFAQHGLDALNHVVEMLPPSDPGPEFQVNIDRLTTITGRRPLRSLSEIVAEMVAAAENTQTRSREI
jgi:GDPmannose 4,6-dehydratase